MSGLRARRARLSDSRWPVSSASPRVLAYLFAIDALAVVLAIAAVSQIDNSGHSWATLALLAVIAVGFEEGATRASRLQIRLSSPLRCDMTSVWAVAAAVALQAGHAVVLLSAICLYAWLRQWRPAGEALYRKLFVTSTIVTGALAAGAASRVVTEYSHGLPWAISGAVPVVVAIFAYTAVNRALVTVGLVTMGLRGRDLLGSRHDNLIELATLCLGGLVALAVLHEPWLAVLVVAPMVTLQRGALVRELEAAAMTDAKTGLLNAVAWEQLALRELARAKREQTAIAVLIIDIDRFKTVNDRFGHLAGDKVLRGVGRSLTSSVREYDGLGRFGGEEFVAVLPDADERTALAVAERIRERINHLDIAQLVDDPGDIGAGLLSVSVGVACMPLDGSELPDLLHSADQALYRAKAGGRNQVRLADRGDGIPERITAN